MHVVDHDPVTSFGVCRWLVTAYLLVHRQQSTWQHHLLVSPEKPMRRFTQVANQKEEIGQQIVVSRGVKVTQLEQK